MNLHLSLIMMEEYLTTEWCVDRNFNELLTKSTNWRESFGNEILTRKGQLILAFSFILLANFNIDRHEFRKE
jgi:hypothetical protein